MTNLTQKPTPGRAQQGSGTVRLRRLDRWQADNHRERLADLHMKARELTQGQESGSREDFLHRLAHDARRPGFDMVIAERETLVGYAFGFPLDRGGAWWQGLLGGIPQSIEQLTASGHVFAMAELMVHPHYQHRGIGQRLHYELLTGQHATLGAVLVDPAVLPACEALRSWGWQDIGEVRTEPGAPALRALIRLLEQPISTRPKTSVHDVRSRNPE